MKNYFNKKFAACVFAAAALTAIGLNALPESTVSTEAENKRQAAFDQYRFAPSETGQILSNVSRAPAPK